MTVLYRCSACKVTVDAIKSSGGCDVAQKGWGTARVRLSTYTDDDGLQDSIDSDEVHLCPDCMGETDADALMLGGLPPSHAKPRKLK